MSELDDTVEKLVEFVVAGRTIEALEQYYAEDVVVFENREMARAGLRACVEFERDQLARAPRPPRIRCLGFAVSGTSDKSFVQWEVRFCSTEGRVLLLEEVAVQKWAGRKIIEERFYYEGVVDEGPMEEGF